MKRILTLQKIKIVYDENSDEILRASGDFAEQKLGKK